MKRLNHLPLLVLCLLLTPALARAGNVSGTVRDLFTRNPVQNVRVYEQNGITVGDTTDANGNFTLNNVPNGYGKILFISDDHLNAQHDSLNVTGNQTFNATLPDTLWTNSDSTNSRFRVKANELKDVYIDLGKNPYLWNTQSSVNVPFTISNRFSSTDTANIRTALRWLNASLDTINVIKFVEGSDTLQGIYYRPGSSNSTQTLTSGGYIDWAVVDLSTTDMITTQHETHHAIGYPARHVTTYSPTNFAIIPNVVWQPKDKGYKSMGYLLQRTRQDGINNLDMRDFTDTLTVGVEIEPKVVVPVRNNGLILHAPHPNPARDFVNLKYSLDGPRRVEISLYNGLGQLVGKKKGACSPGAHACLWDVSCVPAGVYFLVLGDCDVQSVARFLVVH